MIVRDKNRSIQSKGSMSKNTLMTKESYVNPIEVEKKDLYKYDDDDKRHTYIVRKMLLTPKVAENS